MKIYVCESYHDNDCGVFVRLESAQQQFHACDNCEALLEYDTTKQRNGELINAEQLEYNGDKLGIYSK